MTSAMQLAAACVVILFAAAGQTRAGVVTFQVNDIGSFAGYAALNTGQTYSGTGFVGMYSNNRFAHLLGVDAQYPSRTAMQIDISALAGSTITSALLTFDLLDGSSATQNVTVTSFTADGNLGYFWTPPDNLGSDLFSVNGRTSNALDITAFLQERIDAGADWLGLHLQGSSTYQWTWTHNEPGYGPDAAGVRLIVDYTPASSPPAVVPEPSAFAIFGIAALIAGIFAWRGRREKNQAA